MHAIEAQLDNDLAANLSQFMLEKKINEAELARKTNIPQPTLHKILSRKTNDPRASTLKSLADYFSISIDELLTGIPASKKSITDKSQSIAVISWAECINAAVFTKTLSSINWNNWVVTGQLTENAYALISKPSMEPRFPKGTILIIDPHTPCQDGDMIVVHYPNTQEATLRELSADGPLKLLLSINANISPEKLDDNVKVLGVLVKSIFSFHE